MWQTSSLLKDCVYSQDITKIICDVRRSAAVVEAPLVILQTSSTVYTTLIIIGASRGCMRRASLAGLVGAFCLIVESYMYLSASKRLRFLYVSDASTRDLVSPRRWVVGETWETWNNAYNLIGVCTMATVCVGALKFGSSAPRTALPIQNDIETVHDLSRPQAVEPRIDASHVAGSLQKIPNITFLAKIYRFASRTKAKIFKAHLRRYVATAWVMSTAIGLLSAAATIGPLLWHMHPAAPSENDSPSSDWRTFTSSISRFARDYFPSDCIVVQRFGPSCCKCGWDDGPGF